MSIIRPFRGLRPQPALASKVAALPYDVLSSDEARELVTANPDSFLRVSKAEVDFSPDESIYDEKVYARGKENLTRLMAEGIMRRDEKASLYLYRLTMHGRPQTGLVSLTSVDEYDKGLIKKHEHTRPEKVNDRATHILTLGAQAGPVFSIFKNNDEIKKLFAAIQAKTPDVSFTADDNISHELWVIHDDDELNRIVAAFGKLPELYIADGHHRSEAASEVCRRMREKYPDYTGDETFNYFLNVLFPDDEMYIMSYNRVVSDLKNLTMTQLVEKAADTFDIKIVSDPVVPDSNHDIGIYAEGQWYLFRCKESTFDADDPVESIDSAVLTKNLLTPILGIENLRTDNRIDFVGGIRGVKELVKLVDSGKYKIAFSLYPVSVAQLLAVADAGKVMPPKSTWFEPKLRSGMVVNILTD